MKIVVLDGYTENPGDLSWAGLEALGDVTLYERTSYTESPLIAQRIGDAEVVVLNKTPLSRATLDQCPGVNTGQYPEESCVWDTDKVLVVGSTKVNFLLLVFVVSADDDLYFVFQA